MVRRAPHGVYRIRIELNTDPCMHYQGRGVNIVLVAD